MRKKVCSVIVFMHAFIVTQSQLSKHTLEFSFGPSIPLGAYARKELADKKSGFAKTGEFAKVSFSHALTKRIGISAALHGQRNPNDLAAMKNSFSKLNIYQDVYSSSVRNQPPQQMGHDVYTDWKFKKSTWVFASFLLGSFGDFPFRRSEDVSITGKTMIGVIYASLPRLDGSSTKDTTSAHYKQSAASAFGLTYTLAVGLRFRVSKQIQLMGGVEYLGTSKITFKDVKAELTTTRGANGFSGFQYMQSIARRDLKQNIGSVNLNLGIGLRF